MPTDIRRSRDGQVLGPRAFATRERLLDSLLEHVDHGPGWRGISLIQVAKGAGTSAANLYWHFGNAETALFELTRRCLAADVKPSPRHLAVLDLLAVEGSADAARLLEEIDEATEAKEASDA